MLLNRIMGRRVVPKKDPKWDKNSFQGKREDQIESTLMSVAIAAVGLVVLIVLIVIDSIWK